MSALVLLIVRRQLAAQRRGEQCASMADTIASMPPRVVALLLALVLLFAGFAAPEQAIAAPQNIEQAHDGSIGDDRANDLPTPSSAEGAQDPSLLERACAAVEPALTVARPHRLGLAGLPSPFLEGPQRPPCPTHVLA
jgi:hypothetical protein